MADRSIVVKGAREHNLKNISLSIPRDKLVVITGLSGSGKSTLAFDTIYAEGQRRYLESLSAYARQFLEQMKKPDVDSIDGLSPSISIEQKNVGRNPRSTVGTVTEIYDYLRLLYARLGIPHCPQCGKKIESQTPSQIVDRIMLHREGTKFSVLAPVVRGKKGEYQKELLDFRSQGFVRAKIDNQDLSLSNPIKLNKNIKHDISIYVDRLVLKPGIESRLNEAIETATSLSKGLAEVELLGGETLLSSTQFACTECGTSFPELEPRIFSFNSPHGACQSCDGIGVLLQVDPEKVVPNRNLSLREGALLPWAAKPKSWQERILVPLSKTFQFSLDVPFEKLSRSVQSLLLNGSADKEVPFTVESKSSRYSFKQKFEGVVASLQNQLEESKSKWDLWEIEKYLTYTQCETCQGTRLQKHSRAVFVGNKNIHQFCSLTISEAKDFVKSLSFSQGLRLVAEPILKEISSRLDFLMDVGLTYLTLSRSASSLSGGEAQRIRLATQIGSSLVGVLYILDEPSIGLHQKDNQKLISTLEKLRDQGNSVIVVEHDRETIERADIVIDMGPGAGAHGGEVVFSGAPANLSKCASSLTGRYLSHCLQVELPNKRRVKQPSRELRIRGARLHNLKNLDVAIPLGQFVCVTGVSGSGKSSLIIDTLLPLLEASIVKSRHFPTELASKIEGTELLDKVIYVDQSPIGRTPRSNPATYTGVFSDIRNLYAELPEAKVRGYKASRFSFNVAGGRCEACGGDGSVRISMHFLPDVFVSCEVCQGRRYNRETLDVLFHGKNISDVLNMSVEHGLDFFSRIPHIKNKMQTLVDVGLSYLKVGQSAVTLSGGEAQRIKLAKELNRRSTGRTLYILDEPTTGLHFDDIKKLVQILHILIDQGNTAIVIEHNLDVIKQADHIIDLGPEGGNAGGEILCTGTPEEVARHARSYTGRFLKEVLKPKPIGLTGTKTSEEAKSIRGP